MKRFLLAATLFFGGAASASADYVLIRININQPNFMPGGMAGMMGQPGGAAGAMGAAGVMGAAGAMGAAGGKGVGGQPQPGQGGGFGVGGAMGAAGGQPGMGAAGGQMPGMGMIGMQPPGGKMPEDPNAKWVWAYVEVKNMQPIAKSPLGVITQFDHKWGAKNWIPWSPLFLGGHLPGDHFPKEFEAKFAKEKKEKSKNIEVLLDLARKALSRNRLKDFHKAMKEASDNDPKHALVKNYLTVKKGLDRPFKDDDPTQRDMLKELATGGYQAKVSKQGHYCIHAQIFTTDQVTAPAVERRLEIMENTLETFYYWFAVQKEASLQPAMPTYRLHGILTATSGEFMDRNMKWGFEPMVGDGFAPRRDNIVVMSPKPRLQDSLYQEYDVLLTNKLREAKAQLKQFGVNIERDELLSGKVNESKFAKASMPAVMVIAGSQTGVLLSKALEDQAERHTVSNETVRQLLIASKMFPRHVQIPDWMVEGMAAFLETPPIGLYPTIGSKSWTHLVSYKYFDKMKRLENPTEVLFNVVTDRYFQDARLASIDARENPSSPESRNAARNSWELARCTSWAYIYYLAQNRKLDSLFQYGKELDQLPRDLDLDDLVMQGCFGRAFAMTDRNDPRRIDRARLSSMAANWSNLMQETNLDIMAVQEYLLQERAKQDPEAPPVSIAQNPKPGVNPMPPNPNPMPPNPNPPAGKTDLTGTSWGGKETLPGYGPLTFQFNANGQVTMTDKDGNTQGNFNQTGSNITLQFPGMISAVYTGTINGKTMQGTATNGMTNWTWTITQGAGPTPGLNPGGGPRRPGPMPPPKKGPRG